MFSPVATVVKLVREDGHVVDLCEHVEQINHAPAADDLALERLQRCRLGLVESGDADPHVSPCGS